jgi:HAD superfamily hydrolase (TIGR01509 family)
VSADLPLRGVIFDMDGVLTDSEPSFYAAINDVLSRYGHHVGEEQYAQLIGSATPYTWSKLIEWFSLPVTLDAVIEEYEPPLQKRLREPRPALPGARNLVERLRARSVPVALCTASYMRWVEPVLEGAGLTGMFDAMSTADMVEETKPNPGPYLHAAELLGLRPEECVAIEDSRNGLESALGAGCWVVQLRATATAAGVEPRAKLVIHSLGDFPLDLVARGS